MSGDLLVVGSVAIDSVETPFGREDEAIGGSALYFTAAASLFAQVRLVAVIGEDFPAASLRSNGSEARSSECSVRTANSTATISPPKR